MGGHRQKSGFTLTKVNVSNRKSGGFQEAFTLIELLVVIAIIGLLSTLAVVALGNARQKARDSKRLSDLKQTQTALELYYTDKSEYPSESGTLGAGNLVCLDNVAPGFHASGCTASAYMNLVPKDPLAAQSYVYTMTTGTYTITATLEGSVGDLAGNIQLTPSGITVVTP